MAEAAENMDPVTEDPQEKKAVKPVNMGRFREAQYSRNIFTVTVEPGVTVEDVCEQGFWQHIGAMLKAGDRIEVMDDMMSYYAELIVIAADRLWAQVGVIREIDLTTFQGGEIPIPEQHYEVNFAGLTVKWRELYKGNVMKDGFETEGLARRWCSNHAAAQKL